MDGFGSLKVLSLESRRAEEMTTMIKNYGGVPISAPSMREQKLDLSLALEQFERDLAAGDIHALVCLTGVGTRTFLRELSARDPHTLEQLKTIPLLACGNKPQQVLEEFGLRGTLVGKPLTWHDLQDRLHSTLKRGQHAVVLEYGEAIPALMLRELAFAGLRITSVPVYRAAFPFDTKPLAQAIRDCILGGPDILLLSSGTQALHFLKYAERMKLLSEARSALNRLVIVSIGPACSEVAADLGLRVDLEASPHKMGMLVQHAAEHAPTMLQSRQLQRTG